MRSARARPRPRRLAWLLLVGALFAASPAQATYETLKRSLGNILFAPFDMALSPVVAVRIFSSSSWLGIESSILNRKRSSWASGRG